MKVTTHLCNSIWYKLYNSIWYKLVK
jgi:hypothetical protein